MPNKGFFFQKNLMYGKHEKHLKYASNCIFKKCVRYLSKLVDFLGWILWNEGCEIHIW
jgi:hypothetical protein